MPLDICDLLALVEYALDASEQRAGEGERRFVATKESFGLWLQKQMPAMFCPALIAAAEQIFVTLFGEVFKKPTPIFLLGV